MSSYQRYRRKNKKKKKNKKQTAFQSDAVACNYHHFLFQKRHWNQGYAKVLRKHPYAGAVIPINPLHSEIHSKIHDVPRPNGSICKKTLQHLVEKCQSGELNPRRDSPEKKLQFFIDEWQECCPATTAILRWQQEIIHKYYEKKGGDKMSGEMRWIFEANILYVSEDIRNEAYAAIITNGVYLRQIEGEGKRLIVSIPSVNEIVSLRLTEILTRFPMEKTSINLTKIS